MKSEAIAQRAPYRIPRRFFDDHTDRLCAGVPAVQIARTTARHYYIEATDTPALRALVDDAAYYAEDTFGWCPEVYGIIYSARATLRAIQGHWVDLAGKERT